MVSLALTTKAAKCPVHLVTKSELQLGMVGWFESTTRKPKFDIKQTLEQTSMGTCELMSRPDVLVWVEAPNQSSDGCSSRLDCLGSSVDGERPFTHFTSMAPLSVWLMAQNLISRRQIAGHHWTLDAMHKPICQTRHSLHAGAF